MGAYEKMCDFKVNGKECRSLNRTIGETGLEIVTVSAKDENTHERK